MGRRLGDDRGSILPLVPVLIVILLLLGGLVVDGNRALNAKSQAQSYAEEAARAGATAIDPTSADLQLLPDDIVRQRVNAFCRAVRANSRDEVKHCDLIGVTDVTTHCGPEPQKSHIVVEARVTITIPTTLLGLVGKQNLTVTGDAKARPFEGITAADAC